MTKPPSTMQKQQESVNAELEANRQGRLAAFAEAACVSPANRRIMVRLLVCNAAKHELEMLPRDTKEEGAHYNRRSAFFKRILELVDSTFLAATDVDDWHRSVMNKLSAMALWNVTPMSLNERRALQQNMIKEANSKPVSPAAPAAEVAPTPAAAPACERLPHNSPWTAAYDGPKVAPKDSRVAAPKPAHSNNKGTRRGHRGGQRQPTAAPFPHQNAQHQFGNPYWGPYQLPYQHVPAGPQHGAFWAQPPPQHVWQQVRA